MTIKRANGGGLGGSGSPGGALGSFYSHTIDQSVRLDDASGAHLVNAAASPTATNRKKVTISCWFKRSTLGAGAYSIFHGGTAGLMMQLGPTGADEVYLYESPWQIYKDALLIRDVSAWYHFVLILDTTQSTDSDRAKFYINGQLEDFSTWQVGAGANRYPALNYEFNWHTGTTQRIGSTGGTDDLAGYLAEFISIDGQDTSISDFGETKDGVWVPKDVSGLTLGNAGFYLPFSQDRTVSASAFFDQDDNSYVAWTDPGTEYEIGASDDYTLELFFWPTVAETSGGSYIAGYYKTTSPSGYFAPQLNISGNVIYLYHGNGAAYSFSISAGDVDAGRWHHLAFNRSSGNLRCFLDGAQKGSTEASNTKEHNIPEFRVNKAHATSNTTFDGYISNVRLVIGSAVYSDGSSITVPTSPLTAVTNTKILVCTTTTITADASSNNVTGTASGTAGTGYYATDALSPFPNAAFNEDAGSNGIDFSAKNIFDYDIVPDSPTNNWATNNGAMRANITQSEGNLKMVGVGNNYDNLASTFEIDVEDADGWYWEYRSIGNDTATQIGIARSDNQYFNQSDPTYVFAQDSAAGNVGYQGDGNKKVSGSNSSYGDSWTAGDIISVAVKAGAVYFYKNGTIQNSGTAAATGLTGHIVPAFGINGTNSGTVNYGQDSTFAGTVSAGGNSDANGLGNFKYSVPSGYKALCASNLPDPTIGPGQGTQSDEHFNTVLWSGNSTNSRSITTGHATDFAWVKKRGTTIQSHVLADSVRGTSDNGGTGNVRILASNSAAVESTNQSDSGIASFDSDGFTLGAGSNTANADAPYQGINASGHTYVGWSWKAGGAPTADNSAGVGATPTAGSVKIDGSNLGSALAGSIAATRLSANTEAGFSIIEWVGNQTNSTLAHGLNSTPELVIVKNLDYGSANWYTWNKDVTTDKVLFLNATNAETTSAPAFIEGDMTSTTIGLGTERVTNGSSEEMLAFVWHSVDGFSKVGKYIANNNADGPFIYTGFRPAWVMIKNTANAAVAWLILDNKRGTFNVMNDFLYPNTTNAETASTVLFVDFLSNGFKIRNATYGETNAASGNKFIYLAFAETPFKFANAR